MTHIYEHMPPCHYGFHYMLHIHHGRNNYLHSLDHLLDKLKYAPELLTFYLSKSYDYVYSDEISAISTKK